MAAAGARRSGGALLGLALAALVHAEAPEGWIFVRDDEGIVVHRRPIAGSSLDELRGVGTIEAPLAAVLGVIQDREHGSEWMYRCVESTTLAREPDGSYVVYNRTRVPWPLDDRDAVVRGQRTIEPTQVRITFAGVEHPARPPIAGVVRIPLVRGHWALAPIEQGRATRVEYQVQTDPGGALPKWMANTFSSDLPYETIRGLRAQVRRRQYPEVERELMQLPEYRALIAAPR